LFYWYKTAKIKQMTVRTTILIPTWNGKDLLQKNLPRVLDKISSQDEVLVIENGSIDGSVDYLKSIDNPQLRVIFNEQNLGFIKGCNQGAKQARGKYLFLLNNDVYPQENFLQPALKHFKKKDVFAVSVNETGDEWSGWAKFYWQKGFFNYQPGGQPDHAHISGWASGGGAIYRLSMWEELNGFDMLYHPFYWEDLDLAYRAWQNGWRILWEPEAKVVHHHESTISQLDQRHVDLVKQRNQLLFIWKNINDSQLKSEHYRGLVKRVLMGPNYSKVIFTALKRYLTFKNKKKIKNPKRSDKEIFDLFK
jgi:GT2 family glycosyltransferase